MSEFDPTKFYIEAGIVQPYICRHTPWYMKHFARAEYDRDKPILTDSIRRQTQPILDELNAGTIDTDEAEKRLAQIWY